MTASVLMRPEVLRSGLYAPTCPLLTTPLFAKSCTVFQISLCLFSLTSNFCSNFHTVTKRPHCANLID